MINQLSETRTRWIQQDANADTTSVQAAETQKELDEWEDLNDMGSVKVIS